MLVALALVSTLYTIISVASSGLETLHAMCVCVVSFQLKYVGVYTCHNTSGKSTHTLTTMCLHCPASTRQPTNNIVVTYVEVAPLHVSSVSLNYRKSRNSTETTNVFKSTRSYGTFNVIPTLDSEGSSRRMSSITAHRWKLSEGARSMKFGTGRGRKAAGTNQAQEGNEMVRSFMVKAISNKQIKFDLSCIISFSHFQSSLAF
jgi:hypothetical protein